MLLPFVLTTLVFPMSVPIRSWFDSFLVDKPVTCFQDLLQRYASLLALSLACRFLVNFLTALPFSGQSFLVDRCAAPCLWWAGNPACQLESSVKKLKLDRAALKTALRTAGALMLGNAFVGVLLLGNRDWLAVLALLVAGGAVIILTSIEHKE